MTKGESPFQHSTNPNIVWVMLRLEGEGLGNGVEDLGFKLFDSVRPRIQGNITHLILQRCDTQTDYSSYSSSSGPYKRPSI